MVSEAGYDHFDGEEWDRLFLGQEIDASVLIWEKIMQHFEFFDKITKVVFVSLAALVFFPFDYLDVSLVNLSLDGIWNWVKWKDFQFQFM